ncbi:MAG TPA: FAD:protein FMN transferase, partial [Candidatus Nitrosocosmicus sp.]|nr:FAD:protein FMN transferase [Candidatus Nitrosocosmicus sp.]
MVSHCFAFEAIGTHWQIEIQDLIPSNYLIQKEIIKYCQDFDNNYSRFIPASQISEMAKKPGIYMVSPIFIELLGIFFDLFTKTNGFFTPLIGDVLDKAGYDSTYSFKYNNPTSPPPLSDIVEILDEHTVKINQPYVIDFGGIGKGFLIDKISFILQRHKVEAFSINGSGDIYC